ncbi:phosphatidylinositol-specific phospholipase C domain-containing protein [Streptomyces sp. NPDC059176]|uniref:phosphatidylinositol-specific phospholipase C domain-containing protein n=1 Tax=unclassified Streptomyces TaxID=2593676 RepID=UPI0036C4EB27
MSLRRALVAAALAIATLTLPAPSAAGAPTADTPFTSATTVGMHNTYERSAFSYLAQALDTGTSLIEIDAWPNIFTKRWHVSHAKPLANDNNCTTASGPGDLYTGGTSKYLEHCLDNVRVWLEAHPDSGPLVIKLELKLGYATAFGMGPAQVDKLIRDHLGSRVFRPADLLAKPGGGAYASLDEAARAGNWPTRQQLSGRVMLSVIPGTVENRNPFDFWPSNEQYAGRLRDLAEKGRIGDAQIFPVAKFGTGDPRAAYGSSIRPWFVLFDSNASAWLSDSVDTSWYDTNHYVLVMTSAHAVQPPISSTKPTPEEARARVAQLAAAHASIVTSDWSTLPEIQSLVLPRGPSA